MRFLSRRLYSIYAAVVFLITFILLIIPFLIIIPNKKWHKLTGKLNRIWARMFFCLIGLPVKRDFHKSINKSGQYIFCPNHFSYMDIPSMGYTPGNFIFVGKNAMERVPVFGYMYKKLHITVDRASLKSRHNVYVRSKKALDEGRSIVMFPEGGVLTKNPPKMNTFKNGAFKLAIEKQIPIIPVTIPNNWIILPDDDRFLLKREVMKMVCHAPIYTTGMNLDQVEMLKEKVFDVIQSELDRCNANRKEDVSEHGALSAVEI